jgi:hypothetical protein
VTARSLQSKQLCDIKHDACLIQINTQLYRCCWQGEHKQSSAGVMLLLVALLLTLLSCLTMVAAAVAPAAAAAAVCVCA